MRVNVHSFDIDYLDVWWEVDMPADSFATHSFVLRRSESATGPWSEFVVGPMKDKWRYRDSAINQRHRHRVFWYKLQIVRDSDGEVVVESEPETMRAEASLEAREMVRRFALALREYIGRVVIVFPVRTFGTRCPTCWDPIRMRQTKDRCRDCYDTGYAGGFLSPYRTWMQIDPSAQGIQITEAGELADVKSTARALPYPILKSNDIIVESENRRWRVMNVTNTERLRSPVHSELQLHEIVKHDIVYALPVYLDAETFDASPRRALAEPVSIDEAGRRDEGYIDVLAVYGRRS